MNLEMLFLGVRSTRVIPFTRDVAVRHADITMKNHFPSRCQFLPCRELQCRWYGREREHVQRTIPTLRRGPRADERGLYGYTVTATDGRREVFEACRTYRRLRHTANTPPTAISLLGLQRSRHFPNARAFHRPAAIVSSALFELSTMVPGPGQAYSTMPKCCW